MATNTGGYYICNDVKFVSSMRSVCNNPSSATHMKLSEVASFIKDNPTFGYYRTRKTSKGNDYVMYVGEMKFVAPNQTLTTDQKNAMKFDSVEDAYRYLDENEDNLPPDINVVVDKYFVRRKRPNSVKKNISPTITASEVFKHLEKTNSSERMLIPQNVREELYENSGGICGICGKKVSKYTYTIDHVIPLSRGGTNNPDNLRVVHCDCNKLKGNFTDTELLSNVGNVACNGVYVNPGSRLTAKLLRATVRGLLAKNLGNY